MTRFCLKFWYCFLTLLQMAHNRHHMDLGTTSHKLFSTLSLALVPIAWCFKALILICTGGTARHSARVEGSFILALGFSSDSSSCLLKKRTGGLKREKQRYSSTVSLTWSCRLVSNTLGTISLKGHLAFKQTTLMARESGLTNSSFCSVPSWPTLAAWHWLLPTHLPNLYTAEVNTDIFWAFI